MKLVIKIMVAVMLMLPTMPVLANNWIATNGPFGASIKSIKFDDANKVIYLATETDGIYKSTNLGISWQSMHDIVLKNTSRVNDIIIESDGSLVIATDSLGILKKSESENWETVNSGFGGHLSFKSLLEIDNNVYLAGSNGNAIFRTTDEGQSWSNYYEGLQSNEVVNTIVKIDNKLLIGTNRGIYQSTDDGKKWQLIKDQIGIINIIYYDSGSNQIIAGSSKGLYVSKDKGLLWEKKVDGSNTEFNIQTLTVFNNKLYFGTKLYGLYSASLQNFDIVKENLNLPSNNITSLANIEGKLFIANHFCLMEMVDNGFEYRLNGIGVRSINSFLNIGNEVYAASDMGVYKTTNDGITWSQKNIGFERVTFVNSLLLTDSDVLLAGTNGDGVYYSDDFGETWKKNSDDALTSIRINQLTKDDEGIIFLGTLGKGVFKSNDGGLTWLQMSGDGISTTEILSLKVINNRYIFAGTNGNGLYIKTSFDDWKKVTDIMPSSRVYSIEYFQDEFDGIIIVSTNTGIFRSQTKGISWSKVQGSLLAPVFTLYLSSDSTLYASLYNMNGVYTSKDFGDSWEQNIDDSGLFGRVISSFTESLNGYIFAGTKSSYCYRTISSKIGIPQPEPKITVTGKTSFCDGFFCILDVGEGWFDYKWSNGVKTRFDTVWVEGHYWLSAFDSLGMKVYSDTIKITVYPKPAKPRILFNGEILFCSIEGANYRWYFQDVLIDGANEKTYIPENEGWYNCEVISEYTCTNISEKFLVEFPISVMESNFEFQISPNPATDLIHIATPLEKEYNISINNNLGVTVLDKKIHGNTLFDLSDLTVGFYILKISDDTGIITKKLLINR